MRNVLSRTQIVHGPTRAAQGGSLSFRKIWHTARTEAVYHLSSNCPQLRNAANLLPRSLCQTCVRDVEVAENRRNDIFDRGDTRPRATEQHTDRIQIHHTDRMQIHERAANTAHMWDLFSTAIEAQMADEQLGVTYILPYRLSLRLQHADRLHSRVLCQSGLQRFHQCQSSQLQGAVRVWLHLERERERGGVLLKTFGPLLLQQGGREKVVSVRGEGPQLNIAKKVGRPQSQS